MNQDDVPIKSKYPLISEVFCDLLADFAGIEDGTEIDQTIIGYILEMIPSLEELLHYHSLVPKLKIHHLDEEFIQSILKIFKRQQITIERKWEIEYFILGIFGPKINSDFYSRIQKYHPFVLECIISEIEIGYWFSEHVNSMIDFYSNFLSKHLSFTRSNIVSFESLLEYIKLIPTHQFPKFCKYFLDVCKPTIKQWSTAPIDETVILIVQYVNNLRKYPMIYPGDYTTEQIIQREGYVIPYGTITELMEYYESDPTVFIVVSTKLKPTNKVLTFSQEPLDEVTDLKIGIGRPDNFCVTTLPEILEVWCHTYEKNETVYPSPTRIIPFSQKEVGWVLKISEYCGYGELKKYHELIAELIKNISTKEGLLRREFCFLNPEEREKVRNIMKEVFFTGMYMRRWDGTKPYPKESNDTKTNEIYYSDVMDFSTGEGIYEEYSELNDIVLAKVGKHMEIIEEMRKKLCEETLTFLGKIRKRDDSDDRLSNSLFFLDDFPKTKRGERCIRQESSCFTGTSAYFFRDILRESHDFLLDYRGVDYIQ